MKLTIQNETLGEVIYTESFWTGKKTLSINGVESERLDKNTFKFADGTTYSLKGGLLSSITLISNTDTIKLEKAPAWYEWCLSIIPILIPLVWGSVPSLVKIIPIAGGAIGCGIGGAAAVLNIYFMRSTKNVGLKLLINLATMVVTFMICFVLGLLFISLVK